MRGSGWHHSKETKRKIAESNRRENRAGGNIGCLGYRHTDEAKEKIRVSKIGNTAFLGCHHSDGAKEKIGAAHWRGGRFIDPRGYVLVKQSSHPSANSNGYVYEHRLVAEKALGRYLKPSEPVHHANGIKAENRSANLVICQDEAYHQMLHYRARKAPEERKP